MYSKADFVKDLEKQILSDFDIVRISNWAFSIYINRPDKFEEGVKDLIMTVGLMQEGPEFEYSKEELLQLCEQWKKEN